MSCEYCDDDDDDYEPTLKEKVRDVFKSIFIKIKSCLPNNELKEIIRDEFDKVEHTNVALTDAVGRVNSRLYLLEKEMTYILEYLAKYTKYQEAARVEESEKFLDEKKKIESEDDSKDKPNG
jgi:hypothetical protein